MLMALSSWSLHATTCANATNIPSAPVTNQALVCGGGNDLSSTSVPAACGSATNSYKGGNEALYTFTPAASGNYTISINGQAWTSIFVYAGCPTSGGTCVGSTGTSATSKSLPVALTAGTQYYIWFDTWPTPDSPCPGTFSISLPVAPPANDECSGAIALSVGSSCTFAQYTTTGASGSAGVPAPGCASYSGGDVWFSVVVPAGGRIIIDTDDAVITDGGMALYSGSCGALTLIECDDDDSSNGLMPFIDRSGLTPGSTVYIRFWEYGNDNPGTFSICVSTPAPPPPPPTNDDCAGAIALSVGTSCSFAQYTTAAATASAGAPAPGCASYSGGDVWFTAVVPATGRLVLDTNLGTVTDGGMAIYSGNCGVLTLIECDDDDSANGLMPFIDRSGLTPGSTVYIRFWEYANDNPGTFSICAYSPIPPCNAPGAPAASNVGPNSATLSWAAAGGATSYRYSFGTAGHTCGTGSATTTGTSVNLTGLTPNTTYTFCVRTDACGGGSASSYVSTTFTTGPIANDDCGGAVIVTCGSTVTGNTNGSFSDNDLSSCGSGGVPGNGVWYKLVGNGAQVTLDLCASGYDTKVHVYSGSCSNLACVGSNDDSPTCGTSRSHFVFNASVGVDYYILVSGFGSNTGAFSMSISCICGPALGAPWTVTNVGSSNGGAIDNVCDGTIDVKATGYGTPVSDVLTYASQQMCGNGFIQAKLENVTNGGWGGLMFRESSAPGARKVAIRSQLASTIVRDLRTTTNGFAQQQQFLRPNTPRWMRLSRNGSIFTGEVSVDGANWDVVFVTTLVMPNCIQVGLFTQSINVNTQSTAIFSNVAGVPLTVVIPFAGVENDLVSTGNEQVNLTLYPNPAQDVLNVKLENFLGQPVRIEVRNALGQPVRALNLDEVTETLETINLSGLPNGVYNLTLHPAGARPISKQFVIGQPRP
jgi:hypothetical protein